MCFGANNFLRADEHFEAICGFAHRVFGQNFGSSACQDDNKISFLTSLSESIKSNTLNFVRPEDRGIFTPQCSSRLEESWGKDFMLIFERIDSKHQLSRCLLAAAGFLFCLKTNEDPSRIDIDLFKFKQPDNYPIKQLLINRACAVAVPKDKYKDSLFVRDLVLVFYAMLPDIVELESFVRQSRPVEINRHKSRSPTLTGDSSGDEGGSVGPHSRGRSPQSPAQVPGTTPPPLSLMEGLRSLFFRPGK